jgi:hypothetical protein
MAWHNQQLNTRSCQNKDMYLNHYIIVDYIIKDYVSQFIEILCTGLCQMRATFCGDRIKNEGIVLCREKWSNNPVWFL